LSTKKTTKKPQDMGVFSSSVCATTQQSDQIRSTDDYPFKDYIDKVVSRSRSTPQTCMTKTTSVALAIVGRRLVWEEVRDGG
jgi:hypothetical protein